jgi:IS30 family transposase
MIGKGHKGVLVTLDERKSKLRLALPVARKTAEAVTGGLITLLSAFKAWVHTVTFDNGAHQGDSAMILKGKISTFGVFL